VTSCDGQRRGSSSASGDDRGRSAGCAHHPYPRALACAEQLWLVLVLLRPRLMFLEAQRANFTRCPPYELTCACSSAWWTARRTLLISARSIAARSIIARSTVRLAPSSVGRSKSRSLCRSRCRSLRWQRSRCRRALGSRSLYRRSLYRRALYRARSPTVTRSTVARSTVARSIVGRSLHRRSLCRSRCRRLRFQRSRCRRSLGCRVLYRRALYRRAIALLFCTCPRPPVPTQTSELMCTAP
jgi:hypothetical protein